MSDNINGQMAAKSQISYINGQGNGLPIHSPPSNRKHLWKYLIVVGVIFILVSFYLNKSPLKLTPGGDLSFFTNDNVYFESVNGMDYIITTGSKGKIYLADKGVESEIVGLPSRIINYLLFPFNNSSYLFISHTPGTLSWDCCDVFKIDGNSAVKLQQGEYPPHVSYNKFIKGLDGGVLAIRDKERVAVINGQVETLVEGLPRFTSVEQGVQDKYGNWYINLYDGTEQKSKQYFLYIQNGTATRISENLSHALFINYKGKIYTSLFKNGEIILAVCDKGVCTELSGNIIPKTNTGFSWIHENDNLYAYTFNGIYLVSNSGVKRVTQTSALTEVANNRVFLPIEESGGLVVYEIIGSELVKLGGLPHKYARFSGSQVTREVYVKGLKDTDISGSNSLYRLDNKTFKEIKISDSHFRPSDIFLDNNGNVFVTRIRNGLNDLFLVKKDILYPILHEGVDISYPIFFTNNGGTYIKTGSSYYKINLF